MRGLVKEGDAQGSDAIRTYSDVWCYKQAAQEMDAVQIQ